LEVLTASRDRILESYGYDPKGHALLWLQPWDGGKSSGIPLSHCDPYVIEICRRIRFLADENGRLRCWGASTKATRIAAPDDLNGVTGDPWTPIDIGDSKALNVGSAGFSYDRLADIFLTGEYQKPPALEHTDEEKEGGYLVATALARGQGQTDGFHHRVVPVPPRVSRCLLHDSERQRLGKLAQQRVELASTVQNNVLRPALYNLLNAGSDGEADADSARPWTDAFDENVDDVFFEDLWRSVDMSAEEAARQWQGRLYEFARDQLEDAIHSAPLPSVRQYRAISSAESIFEGMARKHLSHLFNESEEEQTHEPAAAR
jgi:CRISPR system Cascade subunit CasA